jgi:hypothetical protein
LPRRQTLSHWQKDIDLAGIRNAAALAKLPAGEQKAFTFDENVLACHACHYGTVVRLPVVDQYLARVGPTHRSIEHASVDPTDARSGSIFFPSLPLLQRR